jgi:predicted dehydrogenase
LIRNFFEHPDIELRYICDLSQARLDQMHKRFPSASLVTEYGLLLNDAQVDAIAIATPVNTHYELARQALQANKHLLVEKPMCVKPHECLDLISIAEEKQLTLMVDHPFIYHGAVGYIKKEIDKGSLGEILYFDSVRINLGLFQSDVNVVWDLAPHDLAILDFLLAKTPLSVQATGVSHTSSGLEDIAYITLRFENNLIAHIHVSWLSPVKIRQVLIGGSKKMIQYNDLEPSEKLKVYDKGILEQQHEPDGKRYQSLVQYRIGDMQAPLFDSQEALKSAVHEFVSCVQNGRRPASDGWCGYRIVSLLEAIDQSMRSGSVIDFSNACERVRI